jgi:hypothetical protein
MFLQRLDGNWKSTVHGIRDYKDERVGTCRSDASDKATYHSCVDLEEVCRAVRLGTYVKMRAMRDGLPSRVIPGLRAMPAGMTTMPAPVKALFRPSLSGRKPDTFEGVSMWFKSIATPGA